MRRWGRASVPLSPTSGERTFIRLPAPPLMPRLRYLVAVLLSLPAAASGQESAAGSVDVSLGVSSVAGNSVALAGARLWIHLTPAWRVGAAGQLAIQHPDGGDLGGSGLQADFGQAGAIVGFRPNWGPGLELRLFGGVGSVALNDRVTGTNVDTEAFRVVQPSLAWEPFRHSVLTAGLEAGYRFVSGADALTRLESSDIQSAYASVFLTLSPF